MWHGLCTLFYVYFYYAEGLNYLGKQLFPDPTQLPLPGTPPQQMNHRGIHLFSWRAGVGLVLPPGAYRVWVLYSFENVPKSFEKCDKEIR